MDNTIEILKNHMTINVLLTNKCNLNCKHCCNCSTLDNDSGISTEKILKLIEDAEKYKVRGFYLTGGEVTLRSDLPIIIEEANKRGLEVGFFTNGTLVNQNLIKKIKDNITYVCVSIDGPEKYHDNFRNKQGVFNTAIESIKLLVDNNINTAIQYTVTRSNLKYIDWIVELAESLKIDKLFLAPLQYSGRAKNISNEMLTPSDHRKLHSKIVECRGKYLNLPIFYKGMVDTDFVKEHPCNIFACSGKSCHKLRAQFPDKINIASDGNIYPLSSEINPRFIMGNINDKDFKDIINEYYKSKELSELMQLCNYVYFKYVKDYNFFVLPWFDILDNESNQTNYLNYNKVLQREVDIDPHLLTHSHDGHEHSHSDQNSSYKNDMQF